MKKLAVLLTLAITFTLGAQTESKIVSETISKADIEGHIYFLADDLLKGRETGTPELKIAASYLEEGLFDRSDNVNFAKKGIPAPTFSLGFTAFNGDVTKYYHRPGDEAHTLDYDYLLKFFKAYVLAGRNIANDVVTPRWNEGDKYEEASKELYKVKEIKN